MSRRVPSKLGAVSDTWHQVGVSMTRGTKKRVSMPRGTKAWHLVKGSMEGSVDGEGSMQGWVSMPGGTKRE